LLNKALLNKKTEVVTVWRKNKKYTIDTSKWEQLDHTKNKKSEVKIQRRLPQWFCRTSDGTIQPYDHEINLQINNHDLSQTNHKKPLRLQIRRQPHEIRIDDRSDFNLETEEGCAMFLDIEIIKKFHWIAEVDVSSIKETRTDKLVRGSPEYSKVADLFYLSMPRRLKGVNEDITEIISVDKIWNPQLRKNWEHELENVFEANERVEMQYTRMLFHGTGSCDPKVIYEDDKGFLINFASDDGLWGRGVYFAQDAIYSNKYTYRTPTGTKKMILAEVITGDGINLDEDRNIRLPPPKDESGKKRFDCVIGMRHGTFIYVCYDNGRAYPTYVIEYVSREYK